MAVYEYICKNDHTYEERRSIKEDQKVTNCPECNMPLKQRYNSFGIDLRGTGFYRNSR